MAYDFSARFSDNFLAASLGLSLDVVARILALWRQPHRFFHSEKIHLTQIFEQIALLPENYSRHDKEILELTALFHDAVFFPGHTDNEERSATLFRDLIRSNLPEADEIEAMILDTKKRTSNAPLSPVFFKIDMYAKLYGSMSELFEYEHEIYREYQRSNYPEYKSRCLQFLDRLLPVEDIPGRHTIPHLKSYVEKRRPRIGLYPGTFAPFHIGHLSVLEKAEQIFDKVIVAVGINPEKDSSEHSIRLTETCNTLPFHEVIAFDGFLTDLVKTHEKYADITIIRGLRNGNDLDYEVNQLRFMEELYPDVRSIYLVCDKQYEHISSTAIRSLSKIDTAFAEKYKPVKYNYYHRK